MDPKKRRELEERKESAVKGFVESFRFLIHAVYNKNIHDEDFEWYKNAYAVVARTNPLDIIQRGGPPLWDLREHIERRNVNYFLTANFDYVFAAHRDKGVPDEMDHEKQLIKKLRLVWHLFNEPEREVMAAKFLEAIKYFAEFMKVLREEKAY